MTGVLMITVVITGVLPLICGWWLDLCSLPMFDATLKDRKASFKSAPGTSLFIHWMFGMVSWSEQSEHRRSPGLKTDELPHVML